MPSPATPAFLTATQAAALRPAILVAADFPSGTVYIWTGLGTLTWNGHDWLGVGTLLAVPAIEELATVDARGTVIQLSGLDASLLSTVMEDLQHGRSVVIYLALFDSSLALIADPLLLWSGMMDQPTIEVSGDTATISMACENKLIEMNVAVDRRYTNEDQQLDYPGDMGFSFVDQIQEITIYWGRTPCSTNNV